MAFFFNDPVIFAKRPQGTDLFSRKLVVYDDTGFGWSVAPDLSGNITTQPNPTFYRDFTTFKTLNHGEGPNINFTRGTSATYFDSAGVLKMASINEPRFDHNNFRTNLATWSVFTSSGNLRWTNVFPSFATTLTGIDAPDGTTTAVRLSANNQGAALLRVNITPFTVSVSGTPYTLSFWCRRVSGTGSPSADLSDGAPGAGISYADQLTDNVWRRVSLSGIPLSGAKTWIDVYDNKNTNLVLDYWGLQLETSLSATAYIPASGSVVTVGESRGLLIEESRTNSIRNSQAGGAVAGTPGTLPTNWSYVGLGSLSSSVVGTGTERGLAYVDIRIFGTPSATGLSITFEEFTQIVAASGQTWTSSAWLKLQGGSLTNVANVRIFMRGNTAGGTAVETLGSASVPTGSIIRYATTGTLADASTERIQPYINLTLSIGSPIDFTLRIAAPQLELGTFPTSYIPTTTAAATRSADSAVVTPISGFYNQVEGTLFAEFSFTSSVPSNSTAVIIDNNHSLTDMDHMQLWRWGNNGYLYASLLDNSAIAAQESNGAPAISGTVYKLIMAAANNNFAASFNGSSADVDTSCTMPNVSHLRLGASSAIMTSHLNGHIRKIAYYPKRLSNTFLQQITQ